VVQKYTALPILSSSKNLRFNQGNIAIIVIIIIIISSDLIICDNEKGTCMLIDVAISGDTNLIKKEVPRRF